MTEYLPIILPSIFGYVTASACNVKFVYDSSDYVTYLKQKAINKNYNDLTYGGDQSNASQSAIRHIRRY